MENDIAVFIIDDEPMVREDLRKLLEAADYRVEAFPDAAAFLEQLRPEQCGCLLLDVGLPVMSGLELQEHLIEHGIDRPIVFMSGLGSIPAAVQAIQHGAVTFLAKPFTEEELLARVRDALTEGDKRRQQRESQLVAERRLAPLTNREREVLMYVVEGLANKEIAHRLRISTKTVEAHRAKIMLKTHADNVVELVHLVDACPRSLPSADGHPQPEADVLRQ